MLDAFASALREGEVWYQESDMSVSVAYPTHPNNNYKHQFKHGNGIPG